MLSRLGTKTGIYYIDSTSLPVCDNHRIDRHKTFVGPADRGRTSIVGSSVWSRTDSSHSTLQIADAGRAWTHVAFRDDRGRLWHHPEPRTIVDTRCVSCANHAHRLTAAFNHRWWRAGRLVCSFPTMMGGGE